MLLRSHFCGRTTRTHSEENTQTAEKRSGPNFIYVHFSTKNFERSEEGPSERKNGLKSLQSEPMRSPAKTVQKRYFSIYLVICENGPKIKVA